MKVILIFNNPLRKTSDLVDVCATTVCCFYQALRTLWGKWEKRWRAITCPATSTTGSTSSSALNRPARKLSRLITVGKWLSSMSLPRSNPHLTTYCSLLSDCIARSYLQLGSPFPSASQLYLVHCFIYYMRWFSLVPAADSFTHQPVLLSTQTFLLLDL